MRSSVYKKVGVPVWVYARREDAFSYAARLLLETFDKDALSYVMDAELTDDMRAQEYEKGGIRYLPAAVVAALVRSPSDTFEA